MGSLLRYHQLRAQGRCPVCGGERDQRPYVKCRACYTPTPRRRLFPDIPSGSAHYQREYAWHRKQQREAALAIGCCRQLHAVTQLPFRAPCCGRVFASTAAEEGRHAR